MKKILVIRFSSIGDIVLTTPVIRCLKEQLNCELHFLTKVVNIPILEANPYIDKIHVLDRDFNKTMKQLKAEKFTHIVDLHKNLRSLRTKLNLLSSSSSTFSKINIKKWLAVHFKMNVLPNIHIVDRMFKAVEKLGVTNDGKGLDYFVPEGEHLAPGELPPHFWEKGFVTIAVGSKHATKQVPVEKLIDICDKIEGNIILLGDLNDRAKAIKVEDAVGTRVFNACGVFSLSHSASAIAKSKCLLTGDTGMMHIAAALNKKVVSVWGNTVPEFGMYPYFPEEEQYLSHLFEVKGLNCRPCSKLGYAKCPKKHFNCMNKQGYNKIIEVINK